MAYPTLATPVTSHIALPSQPVQLTDAYGIQVERLIDGQTITVLYVGGPGRLAYVDVTEALPRIREQYAGTLATFKIVPLLPLL